MALSLFRATLESWRVIYEGYKGVSINIYVCKSEAIDLIDIFYDIQMCWPKLLPFDIFLKFYDFSLVLRYLLASIILSVISFGPVIKLCRCVFMSITGGGMLIERHMAGDATKYLYCAKCCIESM